jgi:hypothetical protein
LAQLFLFLFKFCLVFLPDAVPVFWFKKSPKLKPGSGQQFYSGTVVDIIIFFIYFGNSARLVGYTCE